MLPKAKPLLAITVASLLMSGPSPACVVGQEATFKSHGATVRRARSEAVSDAGMFAVFKAPLAVNTDGAPTSYHPADFLGNRLAINRIDNGIGIHRKTGTPMTVAEKRKVFDQWRATPNWIVPVGFMINWHNVIAPDRHGRPCIFSQGLYSGYFGSMTALKNGRSPSEAGECAVKDQIDLRAVPAIALRWVATDPLQTFGTRVGDLVLAMTPDGKTIVPAVIGDSGDGDRIGEESVALNMALLSVTAQPATYLEALRLDTGRRAMVVAVLPGTREFHLVRPYSASNLADRVRTWAQERQYGSVEALAASILACTHGM